MAGQVSRSYSAAAFGVELANQAVGTAMAVEGGWAYADVVLGTPHSTTHPVVPKTLGPTKYEPIVVTVRTAMVDPLWDWVASFFKGTAKPTDGAIVLCDVSYKEVSRLAFRNAYITEVTFPEMDASAQDEGLVNVTIAGLATLGPGTAIAYPIPQPRLTGWQRANFQLSIQGIDCKDVNWIGAVTVKRPLTVPAGSTTQVPSKTLDVPNIVLTIPELSGGDFQVWHEEAVIKGRGSLEKKDGTLNLLDASLKAMFTISMKGLLICRLEPEKELIGAGAISRVRAEMFCEEMGFTYMAPPPTPHASASSPATALAFENTQLAGALQRVLTSGGMSSARVATTPTPQDVAARLRATTEQTTTEGAASDPVAARGREAGTEWARDRATLQELQGVAALDGAQWTALALAGGHSLITYLQEKGVVPEEHFGPLEIQRDPFVEALVAGAATVYLEVQPHLNPPGAGP